MIQAAVDGVIDYSTANLLDRRWWVKLRWLLDRYEAKQTCEVLKLQHNQHLSVLAYDLKQETFDHHWKGANNITKSIFEMTFPWSSKVTKPEAKIDDALLATWKERFGDIKDPKVKQYYAKQVQMMKELASNRKVAKSPIEISRENLRKVAEARKAKRRK